MTWYKRGIVDDHLAAEDIDDPGVPSRCRCPWYKQGLSMTKNPVAALI